MQTVHSSDKLERISRETVVTQLRNYLGTYLEGLGKTEDKLSQDIRCPDVESNQHILNTSI
jgi:hypothetical protein